MFNEKLKLARMQQNLTQSDVADYLQVKNTTISNWEKGISNPDISFIKDLCRILHVRADYLLDCEEITISPKEQMLLMKYRKLDDYGKKSVDTTLELEYQRTNSNLEDLHFKNFNDAYAYLSENPMFAMGGIDIDTMNKDELLKFANDQYEMDQRALKLFK